MISKQSNYLKNKKEIEKVLHLNSSLTETPSVGCSSRFGADMSSGGESAGLAYTTHDVLNEKERRNWNVCSGVRVFVQTNHLTGYVTHFEFRKMSKKKPFWVTLASGNSSLIEGFSETPEMNFPQGIIISTFLCCPVSKNVDIRKSSLGTSEVFDGYLTSVVS